MKFNDVKIYKMGPKLGIGFSKYYFPKGTLINISITKPNKQKSFLTKFNRIITLRKDVVKILDLRYSEIVSLELDKVNNLARPNELFGNGKIDMLYLIPQKTSKGFEIFVLPFTKNKIEWLRIWYSHDRGSSKQLEIIRFVDTNILGMMLGQYQAEGTKDSKKKFRLEFTNKIILEHKDFSDGLQHIGIPKEDLIFEIFHKPNINCESPIREFESKVGPISVRQDTKGMKGQYGFRTYIRRTLLVEIFMNTLNILRKKIAEQKSELANAFFAKLLTGDGTIDTRIDGREYNYPYTRIKITDRNIGYLGDYAKIMKILGFKPHILEKHICVRSNCSFENLLYLYKIRAFQNTNNWNKLLLTIAFCLEGRRNNTYLRFIKLLKVEPFTSKDLMENFNIHNLGTANDWLRNKERQCLLWCVKRTPHSVQWHLTPKGKHLAAILSEWSTDFRKFMDSRQSKDLHYIFNSLKVRDHSSTSAKR